MSRAVNKDEFDVLVQSIIYESHASPQGAVECAVHKLHAQGVAMNSIIQCVGVDFDFLPRADIRHIEVSLGRLGKLVREKGTTKDIIAVLKSLYETCKERISHKVFIGKSKFVEIALLILQSYLYEADIIVMVLRSLILVTTDQPDVLKNTNAANSMATLLEKEDGYCLNLLLAWMKASCIINEENRQNIVEAGCIPRLKNVLENPKSSNVPCIVKGVCSVFRALLLDDDDRIEFGHHHEHARKIGECALVSLASLLKRYNADTGTVGEILLALSSVVMRDEFCEQFLEISEGKSLSHILEVFRNFPDSERLNRLGMKLLHALAGNDRARAEIVRAGAAPLIVSSMFRFQGSSRLTALGNALIAALTLRNASNSKALCEVNSPQAILEGMRRHKHNVNVQRHGCRAIRNMVSRCQDICPIFLDLGAEDTINGVLRMYYEQCEYDAKVALRDLGCHVEYLDGWIRDVEDE